MRWSYRRSKACASLALVSATLRTAALGPAPSDGELVPGSRTLLVPGCVLGLGGPRSDEIEEPASGGRVLLPALKLLRLLTLPKLRLLQLLRLALLELPRPTADAPSELVDADLMLGFEG